jgi:hypothetical protein
MEHGFWFILSIGCIGWYLAITGYIAFKGLFDIKSMLKNITQGQTETPDPLKKCK